MDKRSVDWQGPWPALVTPFDADGAINEDKFRENVAGAIANKMQGVIVAGCTGEPWAMTNEERTHLYGVCVDEVKGRVPVVAGTGAIRTADVIALSQGAKDAGCDGVMILPPFFVKPATDDIIAHYQAVSDAVSIPIMLYNLPQHAVNELTPALVARLAEIPNVVAIKDSTDDFNAFSRMLTLAGEQIRVFTGQQAKYGLVAVELGAVGTVASMPNYWGRPFAEFFDACCTGDLDRARAFQADALALTELITGDGRNLYCGTKAAMNILGLPGGDPRLPLRPLGEPHLAALRAGFERHGLLAARTAAAQ